MENGVVETTLGRARGLATGETRCWLGLPYAAPPTGDLRWGAPEPHPGWAGVRDASAFGPAALQHPSQMSDDLPGGLTGCREDCLTLNVYAPADTANEPLPVMVWIHGGGFSVGSGSQPVFEGHKLARDGRCLVVTLNYRLGVLGFLRLHEVTRGRVPSTGNEGLLDQIAALEWLRDNVAAFGGDPSRITVFGESAGAMSIACLLAMPRAAGLFQRAILQSGTAHATHTLEHANRLAELFLQALPEAARDNPYTADAAALTEASRVIHGRMMFDERLTVMPTRPVVDGDLLPTLPIVAFREATVPAIPVMVGCTRDEWRYYLKFDKGLAALDHERLMARLRYHFDAAECEQLLDAYDYLPSQSDPALTFCDIMGDAVFGASSRDAALVLSRQQSVYRYRFDQPAPGLDGRLGACHTGEIPYVFGTLGTPNHEFLGTDSVANRRLSRTMRWTWSAFARDGQPDLRNWPALNGEPGYYRWGSPQAYVAEPGDARHRFWETISDDRLQRF